MRRLRLITLATITGAVLVIVLAVVMPLKVLPGGGEKLGVGRPLGGSTTMAPATTSSPTGGRGTTTAPPLPTVAPSASTPAATTAPPATTPAVTTAPPASVAQTASLPVVVCPTSFGATPSTAPSLPQTMQVEVGPGQASELAVYTDSQGSMKLVAPVGWQCDAQYGGDGTGGVIVHPGDEPVSALGAPPAGSPVEAVAGSETSACGACATLQACALFTAAASTYQSQLHTPCPVPKPAAETVYPISSGIVAFEDPPGSRGLGVASGGANPANSVMTYHPDAANGSWQETCTLPANQKAICTTILNNFIASYGTF